MPSKDLTGKTFGKLTVIRQDGRDAHRNVRWFCQCQCGNVSRPITTSLVQGRSTSCGCNQVEASRRPLYPGDKFDRLTVLNFEGVANQRSLYRCRCSCGNETVVQAHRSRQGVTRSCGCHRKTHGLSGTPEYARLQAGIRRVRKLNAEGSHSLEDIQALFDGQQGLCYYCNVSIPPYHIEHKIPLSRGGSDYKENICLACPTCNLRKSSKTDLEFKYS
jgi:5-methylcytosine-specific restriction endonuclease McrA